MTDATLDPPDWTAFRALAHRMVDDMLDHLAALREQPAWREMPHGVRASFTGPVPREGRGEVAAYRAFTQRVMPYTNGNLHPRFWGWVQGQGTPLAMMAEMLAAGLNPHLAGFNQAPTLVEEQTIAWLAELMGMPTGTSGLLVSSGTMANVLGLAVARQAGARAAGFDVRQDGLQSAHPPLVFYGSTETHNWARKAAAVLGLGERAFRRVPVDTAYRMDLDALRAAIAADRRAGAAPFCVVGTAGTVNTGAIDDLTALADLCAAEELWFHVDGAFGALAALSPVLRHRVAGIERADSLGFDPHKWLSMPFECACLLVRDGDVHRSTFATGASYIAPAERGVIAGGIPFTERGIDLTRDFKALKLWMSFQAYGVDAFVRVIDQNVAQAAHLAARIRAHPALELLAPVPLNVVCFRYAPAAAPPDLLDDVNRELLLRLQESGIAVPSGTVIDGRYAIRVANVNHRSRIEDFDLLADAVARIGGEIMAERGEVVGASR